MAQKTVNTNNLTPGAIILIRGQVTYSHITKKIEGDELARQVDRARRDGRIPPDPNKPYTQLSIDHVTVPVKDKDHPTLEETYALEHIYQIVRRETGETVWCYQGMNKGRDLPKVLVRNAQGGYDEIQPEGELANGLNVTLVMRVFTTNLNNGISMDAIMVDEPIRYFTSNDVLNQLEKLGVAVTRKAAAPAAVPGYSDAQPQKGTTAPAAPVAGNPFSTATPATATKAQTSTPQSPLAPNPFTDAYAIPDNSAQSGGIVYDPREGRY